MSKVKITQIKSVIDRSKDQKATMYALGMRKMNRSRIITINPQLEGMIKKVSHLLKIENI